MKVVKITFESNDKKNQKAVVEIVDDTKLTLEFKPAVHKDDTSDYLPYLNVFLKTLIKDL
ncbi:MAG: hypothetical protein LBE36_06540 [Flavobacteriaceae bacterium]|jgi:hypothetical protein|nr:hypothetical protein [Flavobacteriaceae bacterium]